MIVSRSNLLLSIGFLTGLVLLTHVFAALSRGVAPDGDALFLNHDRKQLQILSSAGRDLEAVTIGNSHNGSLAIHSLGLSGVELTRPSADLFETLYILRNITPRLKRLKVVFMPISYFTFTWDAGSASETRVRRRHLYQTLTAWRPIPGDLRNFLAAQGERFFPVEELVREDNFRDVFVGLLGGRVPEPGPVAIGDDDFRYMRSDELEAQVRSRAEKTLRSISEMRRTDPQLEEHLLSCLRDIVGLLREKGIRPVFFTPPYTEPYNRYYTALHPELLAQMNRHMSSLHTELRVDYYDFSQDPEFSSRSRLFADGDHLNGLGRAEFSTKFRRVLGQLLGPPTQRQVAGAGFSGNGNLAVERVK